MSSAGLMPGRNDYPMLPHERGLLEFLAAGGKLNDWKDGQGKDGGNNYDNKQSTA